MSEHNSPIKTPKQLITVIVLSFIIPIIVIILLVNYVDFGNINGAGTDSFSKEAVKKRISPVASVNYKDPNAPIAYKTGEEVYKLLCVTCHASGAAGAPKLGNAGDWSARVGQGLNGLLHSLLNGKGAMQARAGTSADDYSDYELSRAIVYMVNASGGNLQEPSPPVAPTKVIVSASTENVVLPATTAPITDNNKPEVASNNSNISETGKKVFEQACIACHGSGVAGAPKFGDKAAWSNRISLGADALYKSALNGKGAMPPKGGFSGSDEDFKAAVNYMLDASK